MIKEFNEDRFAGKLQEGLDCVERVLGNNKKHKSPESVGHSYTDKYSLAEYLTNTCLEATLNCFRSINFTPEQLIQLKSWATQEKQIVTVELRAHETCSFLRKKIRKVESDTKYVSSILSPRGIVDRLTANVVTKITEYFWKFTVDYSLVAYKGTEKDKAIIIHQRKATVEIITTSDYSPRPKESIQEPISVNVTWFFQNVTDDFKPHFLINRESNSCHTPRRNSDIANGLAFAVQMFVWADQIWSYFKGDLFSLQMKQEFDMAAINSNGLFVPVLPVFVKLANPEADANVLLPEDDIHALLGEQMRSIQEKLATTGKLFTETRGLVTFAEVTLIVILEHLLDIMQSYSDGIQLIEEMLRKQLISAIGKVVTPQDFAQYMNFHYRKIFKEEFKPQKICYCVTRVDHHPEGVFAIETTQGSTTGLSEPVVAITRNIQLAKPMKFTLDAATRVTLRGECFVHAWINHQFSDSSAASFQLTARSGPYSSFILMVGNLHAADEFHPTHATIVQSKDLSLSIPLLLEHIPSAKEFRDATESLSPEMKAFCAAYRGMQLESTLFGLCVIQIKPQMEKLLNLPDDSLTKEIELTEDLQELFIRYQIPSDLLSYDGDIDAPIHVQIDRVKHLVNEMKVMVEELKADEIHDAKSKAQYKQPMIVIPESDSEEEEEVAVDLSLDLSPPTRGVQKRRRRSITQVLKRALSREKEMYASPMFDDHVYKKKKTSKSGKKQRKSKKKSAVFKDVPPMEKEANVEQTGLTSEQNVEQVDQLDQVNQMQGYKQEEGVDVTQIPAELDSKFELLDTDGALRSSIIRVGDTWKKTHQPSFLTEPKETQVVGDALREEKNKAFDLLDALSRSGILDIDRTSFHVIMSATHSFDETLMNTLIQRNINPIAQVERSSLIVGSTIHKIEPQYLLQPHCVEIAKKTSPQLF